MSPVIRPLGWPRTGAALAVAATAGLAMAVAMVLATPGPAHAQTPNDPLAEPKADPSAPTAPEAEEPVDENAGRVDDDPNNPDAVTSDDLEERDDIPQKPAPR